MPTPCQFYFSLVIFSIFVIDSRAAHRLFINRSCTQYDERVYSMVFFYCLICFPLFPFSPPSFDFIYKPINLIPS